MKKITFALLFSVLGLVLSLSILPTQARASSGYVGIGVTIQLNNQTFTITDVLNNGPAARVGVLAGDTLFQVDGRSIQGLSLDNVVGLLRGDVGSPVTLTVLSRNASAPHDVTAFREYIQVPCFIEGFANLRLQGNPQFGNVSGYIGNDYINWNVNYGRISAYLKGESLVLQVQQQGPNSYQLTGWIHNQYMNWVSAGAAWNFYQACIPD